MQACSVIVTLLKVAVVVLLGASLNAGGEQLVNRGKDGLALDGYDPVAYFEGAPLPGKADFEFVWNGTRYRFVSAANRERFSREPDRYAPQYGGFCAYAVSRGYTADVDPLAWTVVDGKLYLNYSKRVQRTWKRTRQATSGRRTQTGRDCGTATIGVNP